jgi:hypothetical protein
MTQRIFDIENEKDYADLWDILPDEAEKSRKVKTGIEFLDKDNEPCLYIHDGDGGASIIKINWHDKTEITRPVDYKSMIGCVGWFWDNEEDIKDLAVLQAYDTHDDMGFYFKAGEDIWYKFFTPAKKSELKFWGEDK